MTTGVRIPDIHAVGSHSGPFPLEGERSFRVRQSRRASGRLAEEEVFDLLAPAYDLLASPSRVSAEIGALLPRLRAHGVRRILDAGCAAGSHSVCLGRHGFDVTGFDLSRAMIREAKLRAARADVKVRFVRKDLADACLIRGARFDAVLCLGNTIAYANSSRVRARVLRGFHHALRPGGLLVLQLRDLNTIRRTGHVFPTRSYRRGEEEWILLRRQDPVPGGIRFQVMLLYRRFADDPWVTRSTESVAKVTGVTIWREAIRRAGFSGVLAATDLAGTPRRRRGGSDLVLFASKP